MARRGGTLPGTPDEETPDRVVLHVDMDCFYAACERLREPELRGEPVVVGMGYEPGDSVGAVATASYEAREYGVESAQAISQALDRLPRKADEPENPDAGYYRPVDMSHYQAVGEEVKAILHDLADTVREVSIDEAYLDVTDRTAWEVAEGFARHVRERIESAVGVTASVGVAPNMSAAKVASDHDKPDGLVVVPPGDVESFLAPLDVEELHGVGPVTARELRAAGIETAGDLAAADVADLEERFGERGRELHARARGDDDREVTPVGRPKSLSRESAFAEPTADAEEKRRRVRTLAEAVADRATRKDALYRTIGIKVVEPPYDVNTRERSLPGPVDEPDLVEEVALELLGEFDGDPVRKVGVRVSNLSFADADQSRLDGWDGDDSSADDGSAGVRDADDNRERDGEDGRERDVEDGRERDGEDGREQNGEDGRERDGEDGRRRDSADGRERDSEGGRRRDSADGREHDRDGGRERDSTDGRESERSGGRGSDSIEARESDPTDDHQASLADLPGSGSSGGATTDGDGNASAVSVGDGTVGAAADGDEELDATTDGGTGDFRSRFVGQSRLPDFCDLDSG